MPVPALAVPNSVSRICKAELVRQGSDVTLIACGTTVHLAVAAAEALHAEGISARVLNMATINPLAALAKAGHLRARTVDAWLLWTLTGGNVYATDHSNASRTQLFDTETLAFNPDLCPIFGVPLGCLPSPLPSDSRFGETAANATAHPEAVPVLAMMGDSHAALYGHGERAPGTVKATYGTGSSLMTLTPGSVASTLGLSGTIAWTNSAGTAYALEGNITVSTQAAAFTARLLGLENAAALSALARTVPDSGGVSFVPALAGLAAPHWDDYATGTITGMTHATCPAHIARATFVAIAHQIADVFVAMEHDMGHALHDLRTDGGASINAFPMQIQADLIGRRVLQLDIQEIGALGAASMALGADLSGGAHIRAFDPQISEVDRARERDLWARALTKART